MRIGIAFRAGAGAAAFAVQLLASTAAAAADVDMYDGQWRYQLTPYGWFPSIRTGLNFRDGPTVEVRPSSYLHDLQFAAMLWGEARKGPVSIFTDIFYADISSLKATQRSFTGPGGEVTLPVEVNVNVGIRELVWSVGAGYTIVREPGGTLEVFGGVRYGGIRTSVEGSLFGPEGVLGISRSINQNANLWDGIVGVKGQVRLSEDGKWFLPYYADIGAGNSNWTWNGVAGIGYRFDWGDVLVAYRNLAYNMTGNGLIKDMNLGGPAIGVSFRW